MPLRKELADTGILKGPTGEEIARLTLNGKYLVIDPFAFYEIVTKYANKHRKRTPYAWIYQTFGKSGTRYPDAEVRALITSMEQHGFLYKGKTYVIPLVYYPLPENAYPPYVTQREVVAGLEPIDEY